MVAKKHLENEENVFRSIRKQFNEIVESAIKKYAKTRESDIAKRTETLKVAATQRWDAIPHELNDVDKTYFESLSQCFASTFEEEEGEG